MHHALRMWVVVPLFFSHCGYTLRHRLKDSFTHPRGIFVRVFDNRSDETGAEQIFTNALIRELESRNEVIVANRKAAGVEFRGVINGINLSVTSLTSYGDLKGLQPEYSRLPAEIGVQINLTLELFDLQKGHILWQRKFDGFRRVNTLTTTPRTFDFQAPSSTGLINQSIVRSIYPDIARSIMRDVYDEMVEWF